MPRQPLYDEPVAKFNLRLPRPLYEACVRRARLERLSLNQWIVRELERAASACPPPDAAETESKRSY